MGLFAYNTGTIGNLTLSNESITGAGSVGGLAGWNLGTLSNDHTGGSVSATSGGNFVGGLAGYNFGTISNDSSSATVGGSNFSGGLLGAMSAGSVANSYATGAVTGSNYTGGLIGQLNAGSVNGSYATGAVHGSFDSGGLIGQVSLGNISDSYATGAVSGAGNSGGLVGQIAGGSISNSYAAGAVSGSSVGGLVANASGGSITTSYWDTASTNQSSSAGGTGLSAAQMTQGSNFAGFGFTGSTPVWRIYNGDTMPLLESFLTPLTITAANVTKVYDASSTGLSAVSYSLPSAAGSAALFGLATPYGSVAKNNVGSYSANLWSNQQGYDITLAGGNLVVTPRTLTDNLVANNKVYDGTTTATFTHSLVGVLSGDTVTDTVAAAFADKNAGSNKTVAVSSLTLSGSDALNYSVPVLPVTTASITPATITASLSGSVSKTYDASTAATLVAANFNVTGVIGADNVSLVEPATGSYSSANVGTALAVSASGIGLSGTGASNYVLASTTLSANIGSITPRTIDVSSFTANNKVYDGSTAATGTWGNLSGVIGSDNVSISGASFNDKNVGNGKKVSLLLGGTASQNYVVAETANANITPATLTLGGVTAVNKVYDGTAVATANGVLGGLVSGDHVGLAASFSNKNVGTAKLVTVTGLNGSDAGNYSFVAGETSSANITAAILTASLVGTVNKVYDGTTTATLTAANYALSGVFGSDAVSTNNPATGIYGSRHAGTGIATTVTGLSLSGSDAGNYVLTNTVASANVGNITGKALSLSGINAVSKSYDGTTAAQLTGSLTGGLAGDTLGLTAKFSDKNAGTGKTVTATLTGSSAADYVLAANTLQANINQAALTLANLKVKDKVYDGTTKATATGKLTGTIGTDWVTWSATFASSNAGVETATANLSGTDARNYYIASGKTSTATITPKKLVLTVDAHSKTYDGSSNAQLHATLGGVVGGDQVSASVAGSFANSNAGFNKTVTVTGVTLLGPSAMNYYAVAGEHSSADIYAASLIVTANSLTKAFSGTPFSGGNGVTYAGFVGNDTSAVLSGNLAYTGSAEGASRAGTYVLNASGLSDPNYRISYKSGQLVITP